MEQAHREASHPRRRAGPPTPHHLIPVQRDDHLALIVDAFADAKDALSRNQRFWLGDPGDVFDLVLGEAVDTADGAHDLRRASKPRVVMSPTSQPLRVINALVATVVPCLKRLVRPSNSLVSTPRAYMASCTASMTPREKSSGVVEALACTLRRKAAQHDHVRKCSAGIDANDVVFCCCHGCLSVAVLLRWKYERERGLSTV